MSGRIDDGVAIRLDKENMKFSAGHFTIFGPDAERPGAGERLNKPNFRMRAAVLETARGPYFVKFTGPAATVAQALKSGDFDRSSPPICRGTARSRRCRSRLPRPCRCSPT